MKLSITIFQTYLGLILCVFLTSCKKNILDTRPYDRVDDIAVWTDRAGADAFLNTAYARVTSGFTNHIYFDAYTTNSIVSNPNFGSEVALENIDRYYDPGFNRFGHIRLCNLILERVASSTELSDTDKKELTAEAKFLKALVYYDLIRYFGRVIWIEDLLTPEDEFELPLTADESESYTLLFNLIDQAIPDLPETAKSGKATKYAALALQSEAALQAAAYTGNDHYYQRAVDAADAIINSGFYTMDSEYGGLFNEAGRTSSEIIFAVYRNSANTVGQNMADLINLVPNTNNGVLQRIGASPLFKVDGIFEGWLWWGASQNLVNDYLVIDQSSPSIAKRWNETSQFIANTNQVNSSDPLILDSAYLTQDGSISELMYSNRDNRFYESIVYDSSTWFGETVTTRVKGNLWRLTNGGLGGHMSPSNYLWRKGVYNVNPKVFYNIPTDYHWVIFRLGRVYLNKAEALLKLGRVDEAVGAFNVTRTIHGQLPPSMATTPAEAWTDYKRERRVELAKELDYYWSLLRWGKYGMEANHGIAPAGVIPELAEPATFIEINEFGTGYSIRQLTFLNQHLRKFTASKRYLFPIPQGHIERNGKLTPNPNW